MVIRYNGVKFYIKAKWIGESMTYIAGSPPINGVKC